MVGTPRRSQACADCVNLSACAALPTPTRLLGERDKNTRRSGGAMARSTCAAGAVLCLLSALLAAGTSPALAQDWPSGPVRIVVPLAAGGPVDFPARLLIDRLTAQTKGVFILENRPGAGGSIGLMTVVQAPPDGFSPPRR